MAPKLRSTGKRKAAEAEEGPEDNGSQAPAKGQTLARAEELLPASATRPRRQPQRTRKQAAMEPEVGMDVSVSSATRETASGSTKRPQRKVQQKAKVDGFDSVEEESSDQHASTRDTSSIPARRPRRGKTGDAPSDPATKQQPEETVTTRKRKAEETEPAENEPAAAKRTRTQGSALTRPATESASRRAESSTPAVDPTELEQRPKIKLRIKLRPATPPAAEAAPLTRRGGARAAKETAMATLQPSPAAKRPRRRASGRQIPDEELTPAERRQNKLRANYAALVEAVKPCLDELAARDLAALQRTPTHFQSFPEYSECREYLRKHLEDTEAYVGLRAQYQQLLINRRAAAKMRVVHDNCTSRMRDVAEDAILEIQHRFMQVAHNLPGGHDAAPEEGVTGSTTDWRSFERSPEASKTDFAGRTARAWEKFSSQAQMGRIVERFVPELLRGPAARTTKGLPLAELPVLGEQIRQLEDLVETVVAIPYSSPPQSDESAEASPASTAEDTELTE
ncbi:MAG: hypothetical protein M1815_003496 [Lichina confinis]|nr:MAG: hypothetical protein M1815_003496 [Lichina confinis]